MRVTIIVGGIVVAFMLALSLLSHRGTGHDDKSIAHTGAAAAYEEPPREHIGSGSHGPYRVIKVVDGDTLSVDIDGVVTTLRLIGLDTPEVVDPRKAVQCFGKEASKRAKLLLSGTSVRLEYDESQGMLDKYGRTLAYLYMEDGTLFNRYMIAEGYGQEYTYNLPYKYRTEFKAAEESAREQKKGLWAEDACSDHPSPSSPTAPSSKSGTYECSRNAYNCSDFATQADAQDVYDACGPTDVHKLDSDGDGEVCEALP